MSDNKRPWDEGKVLVRIDRNPKSPGSRAHGQYMLYFLGATYDELRAKGVKLGDLYWDVMMGFIAFGSLEEIL